MSGSNGEKITVTCSCGTTLRVPATAAGKRGKCPKCSAVFLVPQVEEEIRITGEDEVDALASAAAREGDSRALEKPQDSAPPQGCPQCGARVAAGAVLCVSCGYNLKTGKAVRGASAKRANAEANARRLAFGLGTFALGCAFSGIGAVLSAAIWAGVAVGAGFEIGWIAWGLGAAAGFGMTLGYGKENLRAGVAAVGFAVFGILAAKGFIFTYYTYPELAEAAHSVAAIDVESFAKVRRIAQHRSERKAEELGLWPASERRERFYENAATQLEGMSQEDIDQKIAEIELWEAGAKWDDSQYARNILVYARLEQRFPAERDAPSEPEPREWRNAYREACRDVDAIPAEDRLVQARKVDAARQHRANAFLAAGHEAEVTANQMGLRYIDEKRESLVAEFLPKYEAMPEADLLEEARRIEAWEAGDKWNDAAHVRSFLIYQHIHEQITEEATGDDDEPEDVSEEDWQRHHATAVDHVDAIPEAEQIAQVKAQIAAFERMITDARSEMMDSMRRDAQKEVAGNILSAFFSISFDWMDILFGVLAIGSAFGIATGGSAEE